MTHASPDKLRAAADLCEDRHTIPAWCALQKAGVEPHKGAEWKLMDRHYGMRWEKEISVDAAGILRYGAESAQRMIDAEDSDLISQPATYRKAR